MTIPETAPWTTPLDVHRHGTATAGADKDNGPVTIGFGLGGADSLVPVVIGEGTITLPIGYTVGVETRLP